MTEGTLKILIAKPGLDGHDRGALMVVRALEASGAEVIYTGIRQTPEQIAATVIQNDVKMIGLSILSGAHMELVPRVMDALHERGLSDVVVFVGGIIPEADRIALREMGVVAIFGPGSKTRDIVSTINETASRLQGRH